MTPADGERLRVLVVSSSGGVLLDALALWPWWTQHDVHWAVVEATDTRAAVGDMAHTWISEYSARRPWGLLAGLRRAALIVRRLRPDVIVSAGTGAAIPFFLLARAMGITAFWVSTLNLVGTPGIAARICGRCASIAFVQDPCLRAVHPNAIVIGDLY